MGNIYKKYIYKIQNLIKNDKHFLQENNTNIEMFGIKFDDKTYFSNGRCFSIELSEKSKIFNFKFICLDEKNNNYCLEIFLLSIKFNFDFNKKLFKLLRLMINKKNINYIRSHNIKNENLMLSESFINHMRTSNPIKKQIKILNFYSYEYGICKSGWNFLFEYINYFIN